MNLLEDAIERLKYAIRVAERDALHPEHFAENGLRLPMRHDGTVIAPSAAFKMGRPPGCDQSAPLSVENRTSAHLRVLLAITEMKHEVLQRILADKEALAAAKGQHLSAYVSDEPLSMTERQAIPVVREEITHE